MLESYQLFENVQQAKKYLKDNNIDITDNKANKEKFELIKKLLYQNPNYVGLFTKFYFGEEKVPIKFSDNDKYYDSLTGLLNLIKKQTNLNDFLPKDIVKYDTFEELSDDITKAQDDILINNFYKNIYTNLRNDINIKDEITRNTILSYIKLDDETKKSMTPMYDYKEKSGREYISDLTEFVENLNSSKKGVLSKIKSLGDKVQVVYDKNNVIVVRTFDKKAIKELGSKRWCIVYAQDSYYGSYCSPLKNMTQYIIFDFNKPSTDSNSLFGVSINKEGEARNGASQNKANDYVPLEDIKKQTGIPEGIIISYSFDKNKIKRSFSPDELIKMGKGREFYTQQEIDALNLDSSLLFQYKLLSPEQYNKMSWDDKFLYNDFKLSDEEIAEIRKLPFEEKMKLGMNILKTTKVLSPEEYAKLNWNFKYEYNGNNWSEEEKEEIRKLPYEEKNKMFTPTLISNYKLYTPNDYDKLTWNEKYEYNRNSFTENDIIQLEKVPFSERLKIKDLMDEVIDKDSEEMEPDDSDIKVELEYNSIKFITEHEPYPIMEMVGMDDSEFYDFTDTQGYYEMDYEDDYIATYLDQNCLNKIQELMDLLGYELKDGENINSEGVIKEFFEEYEDFMKYDSGMKPYNSSDTSIREYDLRDMMGDISSGIDSEYNDLVSSINKILPYHFDSRELELPQDYIEELVKEHEINNINDLIKSIEPIYNIVDKYNKTVTDINKIPNYNEYTRYNVGVADYELKGIADSLQKIIDYIGESPDTKHIGKYKEKLEKIGFTNGDNDVTKGDIRIMIMKKDFLEGKVKINRYNTKTQKSEIGWVKVDKLNDYFNKTLFESKIIPSFDEFLLWK